MNYFSIGNKLFRFGLSPAEALVFCAVRSYRNPLSFAVCCADKISDKTGLSPRTIYRALESLQIKGLLGKAKRYRYDGSRAANGYHVARVGGCSGFRPLLPGADCTDYSAGAQAAQGKLVLLTVYSKEKIGAQA